MNKHISRNKHEFNERRVAELNELIIKLEEQLANSNNFFDKIKIKMKLKKLYKEITTHGQEVLQFEYQNHASI